MAQLCGQFMTRLQTILDGEGVDYNKDVVAGLIMRHAPDWRRVLNEAQRGSIGGSLLTTVIDNDNNSNYSQLFSYIKNKDFKKMRQWVVNNMDLEPACIFRDVYDNMQDFVVPESIPQLVLILADYHRKKHARENKNLKIMCSILLLSNFILLALLFA
jgi:hypothetical protein